MSLTIIIAAVTVGLFLAWFFFSGFKRESYLAFTGFFLPFMDLGVTPAAFGGLSVFDTISYVALFFLYKDFVYISLKKQFLLYLFILFLVLLILGSIASEFTQRSLVNIPGAVPPFIFAFLLIKELTENEQFHAKLLLSIKVTAIIAIVFIAAQITVGLNITFYPALNQNVNDSGGVRYPGYFMDSQINGIFLGMISYLLLLNYDSPSKPQWKHYAYFALISAAVLLAGSRSGLLGLTAGFVFLILFVKGKFRYVSVFFGLITVIVLYSLSGSMVILKRFTTISDSYSLRSSVWQGALDIYNKNPLLGIGIGNYQEYAKQHSQDQYILLDNDEILFLDAPENGYLKLLTEFGIIAFAILFLIILYPVVITFIRYVKGRKIQKEFFFIAPIICWLISSSSVSTLGDSRIAIILSICAGFLLALPKIDQQHEY